MAYQIPANLPSHVHPTRPGHPRATTVFVKGYFNEFRFWWKIFAKHTEVVFAPQALSIQPPTLATTPRHPFCILPGDSLTVCLDCCRLLSTRRCDGTTENTTIGCDFHRRHTDIPFAVRSRFVSNRLREMIRPMTSVTCYYLSTTPPHLALDVILGNTANQALLTPTATSTASTSSGSMSSSIAPQLTRYKSTPPPSTELDLTLIPWFPLMRWSDVRAWTPRTKYVHVRDCLHGPNTDYIVQGTGLEGIYYKRCDGRYVNAAGDVLATSLADSETADTTTNTTTHSRSSSSTLTLTPTQTQDTKPHSTPAFTESATSKQTWSSPANGTNVPPTRPLCTRLNLPPAFVAELAWRRWHPGAVPHMPREDEWVTNYDERNADLLTPEEEARDRSGKVRNRLRKKKERRGDGGGGGMSSAAVAATDSRAAQGVAAADSAPPPPRSMRKRIQSGCVVM
jgi:hypothetical protein